MNTIINRLLKMLATGALLLLASQPVLAGTIVGSRHDFTLSGPIAANSWTGDRICVACHAPHNASVTVGMLWSHTTTAGAGFQAYANTNGSMNATPSGTMSNGTKLCLSCHDGSLAPDSFVTGAGSATPLSGATKIGPDLRGSHPIGFTYDAALVTLDGSLHSPANTVTIGSTGAGNNKSGSITAMLTSGGVMECSSCHDVHNTFTVGLAGTGLVKMSGTGTVKGSGLGAQLCLACHNK